MKEFRSTLRMAIFIYCALFLSIGIDLFILGIAQVDGSSMENTLSHGERLIINKLACKFSPPGRGDLVVIKMKRESTVNSHILYAGEPAGLPLKESADEIFYIKRVIAVPGDTVEIRFPEIYINNRKLDEPYKIGPTNKKLFDQPVTIPPGKYFLLGDNRAFSRDSRSFGLLDEDQITGKVVFRIWPLKKAGPVQ